MAEDLRTPSTDSGSSRAVDPSLRIQVYFQGVLDSACFLYAQANVYKALTGKRVTTEHWNRAIALVADPAAFLGGAGANQLGHEGAQSVIEAVLGELKDPDEVFTLERLDPSAQIADIGDHVSAESVVLFAYGGRTEFQNPVSHIVCGVAATDGPDAALHLACSTAFWGRYLRAGEYAERHHPELGRWSNDSIPLDNPVTIAPNYRWRITLAPPPRQRSR
jgi:hypothetical protein